MGPPQRPFLNEIYDYVILLSTIILYYYYYFYYDGHCHYCRFSSSLDEPEHLGLRDWAHQCLQSIPRAVIETSSAWKVCDEGP